MTVEVQLTEIFTAGRCGEQAEMSLLQWSRFETVSSLAFLFQVLKAVP